MKFLNIGQFFSSGRHGIHQTRVIDSDEIIFVVRGNLYMFEDDTHICIHPGEWLHLRKGHRHGGDMPYSSALSYYWLHFLPSSEEGKNNISIYGKTEKGSNILLYLQALQQEQSRSDGNDEIKNLLLQLILEELGRSSGMQSHEQLSPLIIATDQEIRLKFHTNLSVSKIAAYLHCNPLYLSRLYRQCRGTTISSAINQKRLSHSANLLQTQNLSIKEAALASGFNDMAYFHRRFKAQFGQNPRDYLRNMREGHVNTESDSELILNK